MTHSVYISISSTSCSVRQGRLFLRRLFVTTNGATQP